MSEAEKEKFIPLCPDFVIEIESATDRLKDLQEQKPYIYFIHKTPAESLKSLEGFEKKPE